MRCADFGPTPGSARSASTSADKAEGCFMRIGVEVDKARGCGLRCGRFEWCLSADCGSGEEAQWTASANRHGLQQLDQSEGGHNRRDPALSGALSGTFRSRVDSCGYASIAGFRSSASLSTQPNIKSRVRLHACSARSRPAYAVDAAATIATAPVRLTAVV